MLKAIIVDDENVFRKGLRSKINWDALHLQFAGEASNGQEALALIGEICPDIVICDVKMPVMDGIELLQYLGKSSHIKFIVLSGHNEFELARNAIKYGAYDYILKPVHENELVGVLLRAVDDILQERHQFLEKIDFSLNIRDKMLNKYESIFIHMVESRDLESIYQTIHLFLNELNDTASSDLYQNALCEFICLAHKICDIFKVDKAKLNDDGLLHYRHIQKETVCEQVQQLFRIIVDDLVYQKNLDRKKIVYDVIEDFKNNYAEKFTLEMVSKKYYINPSYFCQLFKSVTNDTFMNYVIKFRISKAQEFMQLGNFKIYQIAEMVGYEDEKYFSQLFRKFTGISPSEYQRIHSRKTVLQK